MNKLTTQELIQLIKEPDVSTVETSLNDGVFNSTHYIYWDLNMISDTGCDDEEEFFTEEEWLELYPKSYWIINQIIRNS